ncbi:hypothetical protein SJAV_17950 [Sulfurisphaera javensis]|uniref:Uncharacterized protein n=1 Tax=Sulfurisphaera javensis TaxID=2049879 RepID=A0AAT9GSD2_9CREN
MYLRYIYVSGNKINYVFIIPDFAKHRDGIIRFINENKSIRIYLNLTLPLDILYSISIKRRVRDFIANFDEIIRLERIKKKV